MVLGDFNLPRAYETARGLVITILVDNHLSENSDAFAWEQRFIEYLHSVQNQTLLDISFMAERSLQVTGRE